MIALLQILTISFLGLNPGILQEPGNPIEGKKVKTAVIRWADSTLYKHEGIKFENFQAFYTEEYSILKMREEFYREQLDVLEENKKSGKYTKSNLEYQKEVDKLKLSIQNIVEESQNLMQKVTQYKITFWSNIKVSNGTFVYYGIELCVNNLFEVIHAREKSAIGKHKNVSIVYQNKEGLVKVDAK
ncbi:hypothetical protein [Crocinitomix catalasitica]|uniref:hypothetical protein n=1 Tax=Crocinitomix catalasitica TaxID=184607 RepID=UPI00048341E3|nr:hypothetical protein [Crocinitomix catalasitica]